MSGASEDREVPQMGSLGSKEAVIRCSDGSGDLRYGPKGTYYIVTGTRIAVDVSMKFKGDKYTMKPEGSVWTMGGLIAGGFVAREHAEYLCSSLGLTIIEEK